MILNIDIDNYQGHNDLLLKSDVLALEELADTYYFIIDRHFRPDEETIEKVIMLLIGLLQFWINEIENIGEKKTSYLPFDFSDQYLGCFRIVGSKHNEIDIDYGSTTKYQGWGITISKIDQVKFNILQDEYQRDTETVKVAKTEIIENIRASISNLQSKLSIK